MTTRPYPDCFYNSALQPCVDCGVSTAMLDQYYMVKDEVWEHAGGVLGMLCIPCLVARLARPLVVEDFLPILMNELVFFESNPDVAAIQHHPSPYITFRELSDCSDAVMSVASELTARVLWECRVCRERFSATGGALVTGPSGLVFAGLSFGDAESASEAYRYAMEDCPLPYVMVQVHGNPSADLSFGFTWRDPLVRDLVSQVL